MFLSESQKLLNRIIYPIRISKPGKLFILGKIYLINQKVFKVLLLLGLRLIERLKNNFQISFNLIQTISIPKKLIDKKNTKTGSKSQNKSQ